MKIKTVKAPKWFTTLKYPLATLIVLYFCQYFMGFLNLTISKALLGLLLTLPLFFFHTHIHEFFHWVTARRFKYRSQVFISKRLCIIKGKIKPVHFFIIALLPFSMEIIILFLLFQVNQNLLFFIGTLLALSIGGFLGDLWMALSSIPYFRKKDFYFKYKRSGEFHLCKNQQINM